MVTVGVLVVVLYESYFGNPNNQKEKFYPKTSFCCFWIKLNESLTAVFIEVSSPS